MKALANLSPRRKDEFLGLLMLTLGALIFFSLVSHSQHDDYQLSENWGFDIFEVIPDNWVGLVGAMLSHLLYYLLGLLAFFLPVFAVLTGVKYLFRWKLPKLRKKIFYTFMISSALALLLSVKYVHVGGEVDFISTPGGALAVGVASFIIRFFGKVGSFLLFLAAIIILLFLLIEWRPSWWEKKIASIPDRVRDWMLSLFGIGMTTKKTKSSGAKPQKQKSFRFTTPIYTVISVFKDLWGSLRRMRIREKPDGPDERVEDDQGKQGKFTDLFEQLSDEKSSDAKVEKITEDNKEKEKLAIKMTRKCEDGYQAPDFGILDANPQPDQAITNSEIKMVSSQLLDTLKTFHIDVVDDRIETFPGPVITRYEFKPAPGIKVNQVINLSDDLALALQAKRIRIIAPVPGKAAIGVEIPNRYPQTVYLKDVVTDQRFKSNKILLPMALGLTTAGEPYVADLASMPHLLIAGATGSGKSVCMNVIVSSLIFRHHPRNLRFIFIDPKMLELSVYSGIPHLERPVITKAKQAERVLNDAVVEMENRYKKLASKGVRNIVQYNNKVQASERLPYLVIAVDELADLMMSQSSSRIEILLTRLAQMARAVGIHLILATQRPSVDVITGLIKANFSARIAFQVATKIDSRTILDGNGAEKLLGRGDMLFLEPGQAEPVRIHGALITSEETGRLVEILKTQDVEVRKIESMTEEALKQRALVTDADPLFKEAAEMVIRHKQGSVSLLQRRLGIGYQRAARLIDLLEAKGVVGPYDGSKAREVLADQTYLEKLRNN
ncbi:MAG: DNA translocase FtsK [candidate division Zixibacteria bacterium]|nr:DNA translocase FtsK [candidate division Zixibacteria bacterium]NIR65870.1 DNA translocase FtsK [candidate division Zixibacteria bacterium]NIS16508.1 DNA translocase FtsK [candidate division Zixibacteria bacterium]NIS47524.1 DNA translocase FtsK [candidate division Zixibacteria bacterium]NIT52881.1 DNA translocase FtsK [candidate division Zixibacteria bacterium]